MKVIFFAQAREAASCGEAELEIGKPVAETEFWALLTAKFPRLEAMKKTARLARFETYLQKDEMIQPGDEIAVIPPVSGG